VRGSRSPIAWVFLFSMIEQHDIQNMISGSDQFTPKLISEGALALALKAKSLYHNSTVVGQDYQVAAKLSVSVSSFKKYFQELESFGYASRCEVSVKSKAGYWEKVPAVKFGKITDILSHSTIPENQQENFKHAGSGSFQEIKDRIRSLKIISTLSETAFQIKQMCFSKKNNKFISVSNASIAKVLGKSKTTALRQLRKMKDQELINFFSHEKFLLVDSGEAAISTCKALREMGMKCFLKILKNEYLVRISLGKVVTSFVNPFGEDYQESKEGYKKRERMLEEKLYYGLAEVPHDISLPLSYKNMMQIL
jgi:Mn-dependent DtxR family transcriptional regulator